MTYLTPLTLEALQRRAAPRCNSPARQVGVTLSLEINEARRAVMNAAAVESS